MAGPGPVPKEHGRFDYSAIVDRKPLRWPEGARVAVWVIPNIEHFLFDGAGVTASGAASNLKPDVMNFSWRDYGLRVGICASWRSWSGTACAAPSRSIPMSRKNIRA